MRKLRRIFITGIVLIFSCWLLTKLNVLPSLKNIFTTKPVVIDETPILIKEIKSIGQLITYSSFDEVVADSVVTTRGAAFVNSVNHLLPLPILPSGEKQLVLIGKGKVLAGINLSLLSDSAVSLKNDTLRIHLPPAQILDAIVNPADFETFIEKGDWSNEEVTLVKIKARRKMIEHALQQNIVVKADSKAKEVMLNFLGNLGYKQILIL